MTALEIFNARRKIGTLSRDYGKTIDDVLHIEDAKELDIIETALTPKTAVEICKALTLFLKERDVKVLGGFVGFTNNAFWFFDEDDYRTEICRYDEMENSIAFWYRNNLTPEHISAIGTFFENKRKEQL